MLDGIKIIDFTRLLPGPVSTHLLAQMGAEVIKIESPKRMDYARFSLKNIDGASALFHQLNHNKILKSIDYNLEEGKAEVIELIKSADALIEQFRPGAMDAWGLGYEEIKKINPAIVYVSLTGYGQDSAYAQEAGHDFNYLAYSGIMSLVKDKQGEPIIPDTQFADISGAYMAVMAIQAALLKKERTGKGTYVDVAMSQSVTPLLAIPYGLHASELDYRVVNILNGKTAVNYAAYQCADDQWLSVAAMEMKFWNNLCDALGKKEWRRDNQTELMNFAFPKEEVMQLFKTKTRDEWTALLKGKDVCVAPILELEELENHPFHKDQKTFENFNTPNGISLNTIALPFIIK